MSVQALTSSTQYLYISSANRNTGYINDFTISLPVDMLQDLGPSNTISVAFVAMSMNRSYYNVSALLGNNTFALDGSQLVLPDGFYNVQTFKWELQSLLPAGWSINYHSPQNKYTFIPPSSDGANHTFTFYNSTTANLFGFSKAGTTASFSYASGGIASAQPLLMDSESNIIIHCDLPLEINSTSDNISSKSVNDGNIIACVPIDTPAFSNIIFTRQFGEFEYPVSGRNVSEIHFWVTDNLNRPLYLMYDWTMTLKFTYNASSDPSYGALKSLNTTASTMLDYVRLIAWGEKVHDANNPVVSPGQPLPAAISTFGSSGPSMGVMAGYAMGLRPHTAPTDPPA